jgi:hypothetical protein
MTREIKVGLVVACAFVGLTAVVVVNRLRQGGDGASPADTPGVQAKAPAAAKKENDPKVLPAALTEAPLTLPPSNDAKSNIPGGIPLPPIEPPPALVQPTPPPATATFDPLAPPPVATSPKPPVDLEPIKVTGPVGPPAPDGAPPPLDQLPGHPNRSEPAKPVLSVGDPKITGQPPLPDAPNPIVVNPKLLDTKPAVHVELPKDPPPVTSPPTTIVQNNPPNPIPVPSAPPSPTTPSGVSPTAPVPVVVPAPMVSSPPITVPVPPADAKRGTGGLPQVLKYDVQTVTCQAGEQNFSDLSKRVYNGSDKYAPALLLFNRELNVSEGVRLDPPQLAPGMKIYVPPTWVLEHKYARAIVGGASQSVTVPPASVPPASVPPASTPPPSAPPVRPVVTVPNNPKPPINNVVPAAALSNSPDGTKLYRVTANGETLFDIARRTLGNGDDWIRIYQLNQQIQPQFALPTGSVLRLPAEAKIMP